MAAASACFSAFPIRALQRRRGARGCAAAARQDERQWPGPLLRVYGLTGGGSIHCLCALSSRRLDPLLGSASSGSRTCRRNVICASLFGVGAPEALVIGVVALLVFGPKGLAEVARNLGKTLRAFQPTIREIQDVSREFRSTLEREIGIDEVSQSTNYRSTTTNNNQQPAADPNVKPEPAPYTSEELMKVTEEQIAASAAAAWNPQQPATSQQQEAASINPSEDAPTSGGSGGPAAPALAVTDSDPNQVNQSEKAEAER